MLFTWALSFKLFSVNTNIVGIAIPRAVVSSKGHSLVIVAVYT